MAQEDKGEWAGSVKELIGQVASRIEQMEASRVREREKYEAHVQNLEAEIEGLKEEKADLRRRLEMAMRGRQALRANLGELQDAMRVATSRWAEQLEAAREAINRADVGISEDETSSSARHEEESGRSDLHHFEETARVVSEQVSLAYLLVSRADLPHEQKVDLVSTLQYIEVLLQEEIEGDPPTLLAPTTTAERDKAPNVG